jgi:peptidoglycan hydrolase CwlO-like protein
MGNIPTIVVICLAAALTILYFVLPAPVQFAMLIFMAASYFLVIILWLAHKSEQYTHNLGGGYGHTHDEKKKLATNYSESQHTVQIGANEINKAKAELSAGLEDLRSSLQNKDAEIENLKAEIAKLNTQVEIEKLRAELADLKALAAKQGSKKK